MVPQGIEILGLFKSPLIATPAVKPVTAGKKIPNKTAKFGEEIWSLPTVNPLADPKKIDPNERTINAKITY